MISYNVSNKTIASISISPHLSQGFTLLEVLVAIAILAITLTALFGSQAQSLALAEEAEFNIQAAVLAKSKLSEYESGVVSLENNEGDFGEDYPGYLWKVVVQDADFEKLPSLEKLEKPLQRVDLMVSKSEERHLFSLRCYIINDQKL